MAEDARFGAEITDTELKVLAHPLRWRMLDALQLDGPATASQLAARFGESSGATSYHLRQLDRHGFVEEDPERGSGRERWWRPARRAITIRSYAFHQRPETRDPVSLLRAEIQRTRLARLDRWTATFTEWPADWVDATVDSEANIELTVDELAALRDELMEVVRRWADLADGREAPADAAQVDVQLYAFPTRLLDAGDETA